MSTLIKARYVGRGERACELLKMIEARREQAEKDACALQTKTRLQLAAKIRQCRQRARQRGGRIAELQSQLILARKLFELERDFQNVVLAAHSECLNLSLRVTEEVISSNAELLSQTLSARILSALQNLSADRCFTIEVNICDLDKVKKELSFRGGLNCEVCASDGLPPAKARITTSVGSVLLDWEQHLTQLKSELRQALKRTRSVSKRA